MNLDILDKSYDIRWIFPTDMDEEFYYKIWFAFATLNVEAQNFAIWYDARLSSEALKEALVRWICDAGKNVVDIGLCSTDMVYFASWIYDDVDIGLMITASHNPKEYNWLKCCSKDAVPINMKIFGKDIKDFIERWVFTPSEIVWKVASRDVTDDFVDHIISFVDPQNIKPFKLVADAGNWTAWVFMEKLSQKLGLELIKLYFEPDWDFPNHHPSPIEKENVEDLIAKVLEVWADLWVAFDWDADRMYICDEEGVIWSWTITTAMISKMLLERNPWKKVLYNAVCWNIVPQTIEENGWIWLISKVWHVYLKEIMKRDEDIIFGWEHSGHYYFTKNWNADSWVIAFAVVLELLSLSGKKASESRKGFEKFHSIEETNTKVKSVPDKLAELKEIYKDWTQDEFDWLTVRYADFWFNVRPSSNEPLLRLNVEAVSEVLLAEKSRELLDIIRR